MRPETGLIFLLFLLGTGCIEKIDANGDDLSSHINQQVIINLTCQSIEADKELVFLTPVQDSYPAEIDGVIYTTCVETIQKQKDTYSVISTEEGIYVATKDMIPIDITGKEEEMLGIVRKEQSGDIYLVKTT